MEQPESKERAPRRWWKVALAVLFAAILGAALFVGFAVWYLRFQAYEIPANAARGGLRAIDPQLSSGFELRYLGVTGYELSDGETTVIFDPAINRPTATEIITGALQPDEALVERWIPKADVILVNHAHYDHAIDAPSVAKRTGATVVGTASVLNLCRSRGVPESQLKLGVPGETLRFGGVTVDVAAALHGPVLGQEKPMWGTIPADAGPLWFYEYRMDAALSYRVSAGGASVWFHPSARYIPDELAGKPAETLIMGVNGDAVTPAEASGILAEAKPRRVIPTHFDNFFQPIDKGLSIMPGLDMEAARALLTEGGAEWVILDYGEVLRVPPDEGAEK